MLRAERIRREFVSRYLGDAKVLAAYRDEIAHSGLHEHLAERRREFRAERARVEGPAARHTIGAIGTDDALYLYAVMRTVKPTVAIETGVANGLSTAFSLLALRENGEGHLYSIDLPRELGRDYAPGTFYEGKGRAGVPPGKEPGWLIPENLRDRWTLVLGRSQEELPRLIEELGTIDSFMHDSEHSFECMWFEYNAVWTALRDGGVLISDDVNSTEAFPRFAREQGRTPIRTGKGMAFLVK